MEQNNENTEIESCEKRFTQLQSQSEQQTVESKFFMLM